MTIDILKALGHHGFGAGGGGLDVLEQPTEPDGDIASGTIWHNTATGESKMYLSGSFRSLGSSGLYFTRFTDRIRTESTSPRVLIPIEEFKPGIDILNVRVEGETLLENFDYAIDRDTREIVSLSGDWQANSNVDFDLSIITVIPDEDSRMFLQYEDDVLVTEGQNTVSFNIAQFLPEYDILRVHQRNLELFEGKDFTLDPGAGSITLHYVTEEDEEFHFTVIKQIRRGEQDSALGGTDTQIDQALEAVSGASYRNLSERLDLEWLEHYKEKDFVGTVREMNPNDTTRVHVISDTMFNVYAPTINGKSIQYQINKNPNDDFVRLRQGSVGTLTSGAESQETYAADYEYETGAVVKSTSPDRYITNIGSSIYFEFFGTGFDYQHFTDTRGGVLGFSVDGGAEILVSTHLNAVPSDELLMADFARRNVVRDLTEGWHKVVATFRGNDPDNAPSTAPARGWIRYSDGASEQTKKTIVAYGFPIIFGQEFEVLNDAAYKEPTFRLAPNGSTMTPQWIPEVNNIPTLFADTQKIYFDGIEQTKLIPEGILKDVKEIRIVQKMYATHPDDAQPVIKWTHIHTISGDGVHTKVKTEFLKECFVSEGFGVTLPFSTSFGNALKTGFDRLYPTVKNDNSVTALSEGNKSGNFVVFHEGEADDRQHFAVALRIHNLRESLRYGKTGVGSPAVFIQHRNSVVQELKVQPYKSIIAQVGEKYEMEYSMVIGSVPFAKELL